MKNDVNTFFNPLLHYFLSEARDQLELLTWYEDIEESVKDFVENNMDLLVDDIGYEMYGDSDVWLDSGKLIDYVRNMVQVRMDEWEV